MTATARNTAHPAATTSRAEEAAARRPVRLPRWLLTRMLLTSVVGLLAVLAIGLTTPPTPTTHTGAVGPAHRLAQRPIQPVAHTTRPAGVEPAFAPVGGSPVSGSLHCTRRSSGQTSSDRASATGYQIDLVINQPNSSQRRPLVISCTRSGGVGILACTTTTGNNSSDRDSDFNLNDLNLNDLGLDNLGLDQSDPRDGGPDRRNRTDRIDLRDIEDILNQRATTHSAHHTSHAASGDGMGLGGLNLNGLDINIGGLVHLRNHNGSDADNPRGGDLFDLFPDNWASPISDQNNHHDHGDHHNRSDRGDRGDHGDDRDQSRRTGICRWIGQR
jgi:hypothetical protein